MVNSIGSLLQPRKIEPLFLATKGFHYDFKKKEIKANPFFLRLLLMNFNLYFTEYCFLESEQPSVGVLIGQSTWPVLGSFLGPWALFGPSFLANSLIGLCAIYA